MGPGDAEGSKGCWCDWPSRLLGHTHPCVILASVVTAADLDSAASAKRGGVLERRAEGLPLWLLCAPDPVYAVVHLPETGETRKTAVLLLPTFGWDNDTSYRARRVWATVLAQAGFPTLRVDLPGTEESVGSSESAGRFQTWRAAVQDAAHWLKHLEGATRIVAVGIGLGGLLAYDAAASDALIDDLILWGVPARGRSYVRELRAFSAVVAGAIGDADSEPPSDDVLDIGGHSISTETVTEIGAMRLDELTLPDAEHRRVLMIERDAHGIDGKLHDHLIAQGVEVTVERSQTEYRALMEIAEFDLAPMEMIARSVAWLRDTPTQPRAGQAAARRPLRIADAVTFEENGSLIRERLTSLETPDGRLFGIIAEPVGEPDLGTCLLTVNAGALRRTGPARLMTAMNRHVASRGMRSARFDRVGLGDSDGRYVTRADRTAADEVREVGTVGLFLDHLEAEALGPSFAVAGVCGGAYFPLRAALVDQRIGRAVLANLVNFKWTPADARDVATVNSVAERSQPPRFLRVRTAARAVAVAAAARSGPLPYRLVYRTQLRDAVATFNALQERQIPTTCVFSSDERMLCILERSGMLKRMYRWPLVRLGRLPTRDHDLRSLRIHREVLDLVEAELFSSNESPLSPVAST